MLLLLLILLRGLRFDLWKFEGVCIVLADGGLEPQQFGTHLAADPCLDRPAPKLLYHQRSP